VVRYSDKGKYGALNYAKTKIELINHMNRGGQLNAPAIMNL